MNQRDSNHLQQRFSLIELIIVMSIIGILAGFSIAGAMLVRKKAREGNARTQLHMIVTALTEYQAEYGFYPESGAYPIPVSIISSLVDENDVPYLDMTSDIFADSLGQTYLVDSFGNSFYYQSPGTMNDKSIDIWSAGADGKYGSSDSDTPTAAQVADTDNDDITNWKRK
ncbi:hypothetical protein BVY04_03500 [bacterium M21]|nr:hypothetical protein BVY04_03500 [bacterium M21]